MMKIKEALKKSRHQIIYRSYKSIKKIIVESYIKIEATKAQRHYNKIINKIKKSNRKKINFAAYVVFDSTFGMELAFEMMINNPEEWNSKIVVIPDILRGKEHAKNTYIKTKEYFIHKYGKEYIIDGWNPETNEFFNPIEQFDVIYYANPYDTMVHKHHSIVYASKRNVLPIHMSYGYPMGNKIMQSILNTKESNLLWKVYVDTTYTLEEYKKYQVIKGANAILVGYSKMDKLIDFENKQQNNDQITILITPHHTVSMKDLPLSNFLQYSDLILQLPDMFPEIKFVFRPHPLLFVNLENEGFWTKEEVNDYLKELNEKGIIYSYEANYFEVFSKADAIINDCGSFSVEWLYTGKPGCFVKNPNLNEEHLTPLMNRSITEYTIANNKDDIISFIEKINEKGKNSERCINQWVKDNVAINYPNVSKIILKDIRQTIL